MLPVRAGPRATNQRSVRASGTRSVGSLSASFFVSAVEGRATDSRLPPRIKNNNLRKRMSSQPRRPWWPQREAMRLMVPKNPPDRDRQAAFAAVTRCSDGLHASANAAVVFLCLPRAAVSRAAYARRFACIYGCSRCAPLALAASTTAQVPAAGSVCDGQERVGAGPVTSFGTPAGFMATNAGGSLPMQASGLLVAAMCLLSHRGVPDETTRIEPKCLTNCLTLCDRVPTLS